MEQRRYFVIIRSQFDQNVANGADVDELVDVSGPEPGTITIDSTRPTTKIQPFFNSSELCLIKSE
jgi:hypothetical protein